MSTAWDWLVEPWQSGIAARAGIALVLVGLIGGVVGVFAVTRGLAYTSDAFAHTVFPGTVLAAAAGMSLIAGGLVATLVAAGAVALLTRSGVTADDTAIAVVYTGMFAVGAILMARMGPFDRNVMSFLFGSVLGVGDADLVAIAVAGALVLATLWVIRRPLIATMAGRTAARADGVRVGAIDATLLVVLAVTVVALTQAVGNMLVVALIVAPAVAARVLTSGLRRALIVAAATGILAGVGGLYLSYHASLAVGGSVVMVATGLVLIALAVVSARRVLAAATIRSAARGSA